MPNGIFVLDHKEIMQGNDFCYEDIDTTVEGIDLSSGQVKGLILSCSCTITVIYGQIVA